MNNFTAQFNSATRHGLLPVLLCMALLFLSFNVLADDKERGTILKVTGDAEIVDADGTSRSIENANQVVNENDTIVTSKDSKIVVRFNDGTMSVLNEESRLRVEKSSWYSYLGGKVYFTFKRVFGEQRRVRTPSSTIGIRGTTFIIDGVTPEQGELVSLRDGLVTVESRGPAFEILRQAEQNEFDAYRREHEQGRKKMLNEFEQYKQQTMQQFVEYRRQFTLKPGRSISLNGYRIEESGISDTSKADFEAFEKEAGELLKAFKSGS